MVERHTSCVVGWCLTFEHDEATQQTLLDDSPQVVLYHSDPIASYRSLIYTPGIHTPMPGKSETFRVEGVKAELRHYLARLGRRSRCFSRCLRVLQRTIKLFVYAWNCR